MHSENSGGGNATGGRGEWLLLPCSRLPLICKSGGYVEENKSSTVQLLFPLHKDTIMLIVRIVLLVFSLHHARGRRMIARARVLRIEDD